MWIKLSGAVLAAMSMVSLADAGLLGSRLLKGAEKGCGCAATHQPACCKPVIVKPCAPNVYTYQRKCSDIKPPCCDTCAPPSCCAPAHAPACAAPAATCAPAAVNCAPAAAPACAAPAATCAPAAVHCAPAAAPACAAPAATCAPAAVHCAPAAAPHCAAPAAPGCAAPCAPACAAPVTCAPACSTPKKGLLSGLFSKSKKADCGSYNTCAAPVACETRCCDADPCEVATLIYESQTACYAKDRRKAIHKLGDKFDCICNPEIMTAFIVGLNDTDERVRRKAADEIGDQIRKNCCCSPEVVAALTCALGDCDKWVVKQATEALELCGYEVVAGNCEPTCAPGCAPAGCTNGCAPAAAPGVAPAPAPVPPMTHRSNGGLQQLLGLR